MEDSLDDFIARASSRPVDTSAFATENREVALRHELEAVQQRLANVEARGTRRWPIAAAFALGAGAMFAVTSMTAHQPAAPPQSATAVIPAPAAVPAPVAAPAAVPVPAPVPPGAPAPVPAAVPAPLAAAAAPAPRHAVHPAPAHAAASAPPPAAPLDHAAAAPPAPTPAAKQDPGLYDPFQSHP